MKDRQQVSTDKGRYNGWQEKQAKNECSTDPDSMVISLPARTILPRACAKLINIRPLW